VSATAELIVGLVIAVGIVGTIVPVLPGVLLVAGALVAWGVLEGSAVSWGVVAAGLAVLGAGLVLKYLVPGRRLKESGVPGSVLLAGGVLGIVGFFVIPVVGLVVGFVLGVYLAELVRLRDPKQAWPTTWTAMKSAGLSMLIELASAMIAAAIWFAAAVTT
jgi:uncharacterized protein YqgC (DUF456 family)